MLTLTATKKQKKTVAYFAPCYYTCLK